MDESILIFRIICSFIVLKSLIIGSDFKFYNWIKYGNSYWNWYSNRDTFKGE